MLAHFIVFALLGFFISKTVRTDKTSVAIIIAIAVVWGLFNQAIWGLVTLGELFLGYYVGKATSKS